MSHEAIIEFLVKRFTEEELRRFIGLKYPDVAATLPGASASPVAVAYASVDALDRHGQLDAVFFAHLRQARGRFVPEIDGLERSTGATSMSVGQPAGKPRRAKSSGSEPAGGVGGKPKGKKTTKKSTAAAGPKAVPEPGTVDVLLVTTAKVEWDAVVAAAQEATGRKYKLSIAGRPYYELGSIGGARVVMTQCRMGSGTPGGSQSAVSTAIFELNLKAGQAGMAATVIAVGIAFGVNPTKQVIGQVLVSTYVRGYDPERVGRSEVIPRGPKAPASTQIVDRLQVAANECTDFETQFGLLLSGEKLVDNLDYRESLRKLEPEAIGGEMEGVGVLTAAHDNMVAWAVVKAICDWGDGNKGEDKEERQRVAARNAAALVFDALKNGGFSRGVGGRSATPPTWRRPPAKVDAAILPPLGPPKPGAGQEGQADPKEQSATVSPVTPGGSTPWDIEARVIKILRQGPAVLADRLDAKIAWPTTTPAEAVAIDAVQRVARKLQLLGPGHASGVALLEHGWGATGQIKSQAPFEHEAALTTLRKLVSMWMPAGYSEGRILLVRRSTERDAIEDMVVRTVSPAIAEPLVSRVDRKDSSYRVRSPTGQEQPAILGRGSIPVPVSLSQLRPASARAEEIADHIARQINFEDRSEPTEGRHFARAMLRGARRDTDSDDYCPWYLVVRGEDVDRGVTTEVIDLLKRMLPSLRVVELAREPGSGQERPPWLDEDYELLVWLRKIFGGSSEKLGSTR